MKFIKYNTDTNTFKKDNNNINNNLLENFYDSNNNNYKNTFYFNKEPFLNFSEHIKKFKFKNKNILKSDIKITNKNNLTNFINNGFKNGNKKTFCKNINKFNEIFFLEFLEKKDYNENYKNIYKLMIEKRFFFSLEYFIFLILKNNEIIFNIKKNKKIKNLKKLKRKPLQNQVIYIKPVKRLNFLFKLIFLYTNRSKKYFFFEKINDFFFNELLDNKTSIIIKRKKYLYSKLIKNLKLN